MHHGRFPKHGSYVFRSDLLNMLHFEVSKCFEIFSKTHFGLHCCLLRGVGL